MFNKLQILTVQMKGVRLLAHFKESKKKKKTQGTHCHQCYLERFSVFKHYWLAFKL